MAKRARARVNIQDTPLPHALTQPVQPQATPATVPNTPAPEAPSVSVNVYTEAARKAVDGIINAERGRYQAWLDFVKTLPNMDAVPAAALTLQTELQARGYKRAQQEASEWKLCALSYFTDKELTEYALDPERREVLRDSKGEPVKDSTGAVKMVIPRPDDRLDSLRKVRDEGVKEGKIPETIYKPRAGKGKDKTATKLSSVSFNAILTNLPMCDDSQFRSIFAHYIAHALRRHDAESYISEMVNSLQKTRIEKGWIKVEGEKTLIKNTETVPA